MKSEKGFKYSSILSLTGVIFSAMLLYHHVTVNSGFQLEKSFCSISAEFDCDAVARSSYSELFGIPVATFALFFYLALYLFCKNVKPPESSAQRLVQGDILYAASVVALISSVVMLGISLLFIKTICLLCLVLYVTGISLFVVSSRFSDRTPGVTTSLRNGLSNVVTFLLFPKKISLGAVLPARLSLMLAITVWCMLIFAPSWIQKEILFPKADVKNRENSVNQIVSAWKAATPHEFALNRSEDLSARDFVRGDDRAPFVLVIFSDFECPFCKRIAQELHDFPVELLRKLRIVFKNYPLDSSCNKFVGTRMHEFACKAALYARCAGAQGEEKFWHMHDSLVSVRELSNDVIEALPQALGLDLVEFNSCVSSERPLQKIRDDIEEGGRVNVEGTPAIFLNGRKLNRLLPEVILKIVTEDG